MAMQFTKATRKRSKLRLALGGPSYSGKTMSALKIATGLGGRIAVIDTENGSADLYSEDYEFDSLTLSAPYTPERYCEAIDAAERAGYDVLIIDSMTHCWDGAGGLLESNERLAAAKYRGNTWSAWSETTPRHRAFLDKILQSRMHVIATMRSKTETVQGEDKKVRKVGMKLEQRSGVEYEFTVVLELEHSSHLAAPAKDRTKLFNEPVLLSERDGERLRKWLESGEEAEPTEEEIAHKRREDISHRFAAALNPSGDLGDTEEQHEAAVSAAVFAVHSELRTHGIEEYQAVWNMIPASSRAALKKYIELAKQQEKAA